MQWLRDFLRIFDLHATGKWFFLSALIGIVGGVGAIVFQILLQSVQHFTLTALAGFVPKEAAGEHLVFPSPVSEVVPWAIVAVMTLGGLVSGCLVYWFAPEAAGHGTDAAIDAFHNRRGHIRPIVPIIKTLASAATLGTGGSAGREGPIAQIGAGFGSYLAMRLGLSDRDRRIMLAAGMGAGIGAIFRAPLAAALFAGEIMYRDADLDSEVIVPAAISSIVGYSVYSLSLPRSVRFDPLFGELSHFQFNSPLELVPYGALAIVLVLAGMLFVKCFYGTHRLFERIPLPAWMRPALGAMLAGILGLTLYSIGGESILLTTLSTGYGALQVALDPTATVVIASLLAVAMGKIVTTSLTIGSGGSGGVFGPSMVIGGCTGAATGQFFHNLWPELIQQPQSFAIVGMAGFFAGVARAPFSTIIMVSEMTGSYELLLPTMWVSTLCFLLASRCTLYQRQVPSRLESPAHYGDYVVDVLEGIRVSDVYKVDRKIIRIPEGMTLKGIVHTLAMTSQRYFPVVDADGRMEGIFSAEDVRTYLYDQTIWELAVARDVMISNFVSVTPDDDLNTALREFTALNLDELPVMDPERPGLLLGMLRRKEAIAAYNRRLLEHKQAAHAGVIPSTNRQSTPGSSSQ